MSGGLAGGLVGFVNPLASKAAGVFAANVLASLVGQAAGLKVSGQDVCLEKLDAVAAFFAGLGGLASTPVNALISKYLGIGRLPVIGSELGSPAFNPRLLGQVQALVEGVAVGVGELVGFKISGTLGAAFETLSGKLKEKGLFDGDEAVPASPIR